MLPRLALTFALAVVVCPAALHGQPSQSPQYPQSPQPEPGNDGVAPAHVAFVDGAVSLEREGRAETSPLNMPILSGDRLRTADGRAEIQFADGSTLHLDMRSTIDVQSDDLVRLTDGRMRLNIVGPIRPVAYRIDSPAGSVRITQAGEYRIALVVPQGAEATQVELAVVRGAAEVFTDQGSTPLRAGERAYASAGLAPSYPYTYNSANWDAFDRWSEERRDGRLGVSSQYLPSDMQTYAPLLDESGDWRYTQSYGYAWYPRVAADWHPYYYGRWASYPRYGWTWIGADRFAWPTHHYAVGPRVCLVGIRARLRQLVPARLRQPSDLRARPLSRRPGLLLAVARLDGGVVLALRRERPLGQPARRELGSLQRPAADIRDAPVRARLDARRGRPQKLHADPLGRLEKRRARQSQPRHPARLAAGHRQRAGSTSRSRGGRAAAIRRYAAVRQSRRRDRPLADRTAVTASPRQLRHRSRYGRSARQRPEDGPRSGCAPGAA